jgi:glycosyltransferase involved in cell wall biosynthesis
MAPRVSVLMPAHNRADVIGCAVRSVLRQTEPDFELLVVGDGCTDATIELVARVGDPRIRIFDLPKAPYFGYANRNVALREARGRHVAFAAHDDLLLPDHLERMLQVLDEPGVEWAYSRPLWVSTDGVIVPSGTNLANADELEFFMTRGNTIPASCVVYPRECLARYGYWPEDVPVAADWVHWRRMVAGAGFRNIRYVPEPTCLHFSAIWRGSRHASAPEIGTALDVADASGWWPAALRFEIPSGVPEQRVVAERLDRDGMAWVEQLRAGVRVVLDRLAWDDLRVVRPQSRRLERELTAARERVTSLDEEIRAVRARLVQAEADAARERATLGAEVERARGAMQSARAEAAASEQRAAALDRTANELLASTCWRVTAPIRGLKRVLRG